MVPILVGVTPFGLVYGATATDAGLSVFETAAMSVLVFAGASQLAIVDVSLDNASVLLVAATAWVINLRMLMYSAALAPHFSKIPALRRVASAYLITDQAFAVSIVEYDRDPDLAPRAKLSFYLGAGIGLWTTWQATTLLGAAAGASVPDEVPLDFAVPLVFLALLVGALKDRPTVVAAVVSAAAVIALAEAGAGNLSLMGAALIGIVAGTVSDLGSTRPADDDGQAAG